MFAQLFPEDYNTLLGPIEADKSLWSNEDLASETIRRIGRKIVSRNAHDVLCLRLLHKHHQMSPGHMMIEVEAAYKDSDALITEDTQSRVEAVHLPNVVSVSSDGLAVSEYAHESVVSDPERTREVLGDAKLLENIAEDIISSGFQDTLAIGIRNKPFFDKGAPGEVMVEISDVKQGKNIVKWMGSIQDLQVIQTLWGFGAEDVKPVNVRNITVAANRSIGCIPTTYCGAYCMMVCLELGPGHSDVHATGHPVDDAHAEI